MGRFIIILILITVLYGCDEKKNIKKITLKTSGYAEQTPGAGIYDKLIHREKRTFYIAIAPIVSPKASSIEYAGMVSYITKKSGLRIEIIQKRTYSETVELLRNRICDFAFLCSGTYVRAKKDFALEVLAVPRINGMVTYRSYIIVAADSPINDLGGLSGRSFAFCSPLSFTGFYYPEYRLKQIAAEQRTFFSRTIFTGSHDYSIRAVAEKLVEGAAVNSLVFDNFLRMNDPVIAKVKIIEKSDKFGIPPVVIRSDIEPEIIRILRKTMLSMHEQKEGREALKEAGIDRFELPGAGDYKGIEKILEQIGAI